MLSVRTENRSSAKHPVMACRDEIPDSVQSDSRARRRSCDRLLAGGRLVPLMAFVAFGAPCLRGCDNDKEPAPKGQGAALVFSSCTICHVDLQEQLARGAHGPARVMCGSCHGESQGHVSDEHNEVKPDRMFAADTASGLCGECHKEQYDRAAAAAGALGCTVCHGAHEVLTGKRAKKATRGLGVKEPH